MGNWPHERDRSEAAIPVFSLTAASVHKGATKKCYSLLHDVTNVTGEVEEGRSAVIIPRSVWNTDR